MNVKEKPRLKLLFYGDSLTEWIGIPSSEKYSAVFNRYVEEHKLHWQIQNAGLSGDMIKNTAERLTRVVDQENPAIVVCVIGANDYLYDRWREVDIIKRELTNLINIVKSRGIQMVLVGIIPVIPDTLMNLIKGHQAIRERLSFFDMYEELAKEHDLIFIKSIFEGIPLEDTPKLLANIRNGNFDPKSIFRSGTLVDGLHPSKSSHSIIGYQLFKSLRGRMLKCKELLNQNNQIRHSSVDEIKESDLADAIDKWLLGDE